MSAEEYFDHDDYVKEDCRCGHRRYRHAGLPGGKCSATVERRSFADLPTPVYESGFDPFGWPLNWPPVEEIPMAIVDCPCPGFDDPGPEEPDQ
jgi:hypothetical protein